MEPAYTFTVGPAGVGFSYWIAKDGKVFHQPSKLWRTKAQATAAAKRSIKRYEGLANAK